MYILAVIHVSKEQKACHQEFVIEKYDEIEPITNRFKASTYIFSLKKAKDRVIHILDDKGEDVFFKENSLGTYNFMSKWLEVTGEFINKKHEWAHMLDNQGNLLDCLPKSKGEYGNTIHKDGTKNNY